MTDVKRLLDDATPLPWSQGQGDSFQQYIDPQEGPTVSFCWNPADAALIVHAVNTLPAYEAAVDALDAFLAGCVFQNKASGLVPQMWAAQQMARAALRAVRGES